jgi:hypothetical protein
MSLSIYGATVAQQDTFYEDIHLVYVQCNVRCIGQMHAG